jgi:hypothetical protein
LSSRVRSLAVVAALAATAVAEPRAPRDTVVMALLTHDNFVAALWPSVQIGVIAFEDAECAQRFGKPGTLARVDRAAFASCVHALALEPIDLELGGPVAVIGEHGLVLAVVLRGDRISAIGAVLAEARETALPTFLDDDVVKFEPTERTRTTIDKIKKTARAVAKVCHDAGGAVTTRRLARTSGIPAFDNEARAYLAKIDRVPPRQVSARAIAACRIATIGYPLDDRRFVHKQRPNDDDDDEDGVEGGVVGGVGDGPPPPPPPPPPSPSPRLVATTVIEQLRISGERMIEPDDATKRQIAADGKSRVVGSFKLCIDGSGALTLVQLLKTTGYRDFDAKLDAEMRTWRYRPFMVNGKAVAACAAYTFIYMP